ncbi:MAG: 3-hydroxyacyl-CoA dehydrogenase [Burkholderiaceae bacterium]
MPKTSIETLRTYTAAVVGAGAMGRGIAQILALGGHTVRLFDVQADAVQSALTSLRKVLDRLVEKGKLDQAQAEQALARIIPAASLDDLADVELVVEAVIEKLDIKQSLFKSLEAVVSAEAILATNTSSLSVTAIASQCKHPGRVAGYHFFNPVPLMKVVEVIGGARTVPAVVESLCDLATQVGHRAVVADDSPGFIVNHAGRGFGTESLKLLGEGVADIATIDNILREQVVFNGAGFKLGPFELMDLTGLDVSHPVMESIFSQFYQEPRFRPSTVAAQRYAAGLFGRKTHEGFYRYADGKKVAAAEPVQVPQSNGPVKVWIAPGDGQSSLAATCESLGASIDEGAEPAPDSLILLAPLGHDAAWSAQGYDATRCIAIDTLFPFEYQSCKHRVLMKTAATTDDAAHTMQALFARDGARVSVLRDSAGFVAQRVVAMIVAIACEIAQQRIASVADIDDAVRIGLGYPMGPISMGDALGAERVNTLLANLYETTGDPRYRPSPWIQRRAQLGLPLTTQD